MTAWSYSSLSLFEQCPKKYAHLRVWKDVKEPPYDHRDHGNLVHKALETAVVSGQPLAAEYAKYQPLVAAVLSAPGEKRAETKVALTAELKPTTYFAPDVWLRAVFDLTIVQGDTAIVIDWKTGKVKNDGDQLRLFAGVALATLPGVTTVKTGYAWLAHNKLTADTFTVKDGERIWAEFRTRTRRIDIAIENNNFPPNPSGLCKNWCAVPNRLCSFSGKH